MRKVANEADGVGQDHRIGAGEMQLAQCRVERREELIGDVCVRAGQSIEERRFTGIGVTHERDCSHQSAPSSAPLCGTLLGHTRKALVQRLHTIAEKTAICFQLRFTGTAQANAALLSFQVAPSADQTCQLMLDLRELDLQLAFGAARTQRKDIEDERGSIDHAAFEPLLEIALLNARERVIEDDEIGLRFRTPVRDLFDFTAASEQRGVGALPAAAHHTDHLRSGRSCERVYLGLAFGRIAFPEIERD